MNRNHELYVGHLQIPFEQANLLFLLSIRLFNSTKAKVFDVHKVIHPVFRSLSSKTGFFYPAKWCNYRRY